MVKVFLNKKQIEVSSFEDLYNNYIKQNIIGDYITINCSRTIYTERRNIINDNLNNNNNLNIELKDGDELVLHSYSVSGGLAYST